LAIDGAFARLQKQSARLFDQFILAGGPCCKSSVKRARRRSHCSIKSSMDVLKIIGRSQVLFAQDLQSFDAQLREAVSESRFLVIGGAGSIGQAVTKEIFRRNPKLLHVVDISENNLVELVRELRSTLGYTDGEFATYALDCGSREFEAFFRAGEKYDYVLNLSALKHVRSEKDPYTLMRMIQVNIFNTVSTVVMARQKGAAKYFCVSTDKAANPVNMMGASKRIMELFLMRESESQALSMARFANVAFSDGSLLHGFNQRFAKRQPISAPNDVKRYFVSPQESGELCLMSCLLGENRDIFFPKSSDDLKLTTFSDIAVRYVQGLGFEPYLCESEEEARSKCDDLIAKKRWPCYFFKSDTTGEKDFEEFYTDREQLDLERFRNLGVIKNSANYDSELLDAFSSDIHSYLNRGSWSREQLIASFNRTLRHFSHIETGKFLDARM
jgi:nucleoside-diphosphate-sugar epimerase